MDYDLFSDDARFDSHARLTHRRIFKKTVNMETTPDQRVEAREAGLRSGRKMKKNNEGQAVTEFTDTNIKSILQQFNDNTINMTRAKTKTGIMTQPMSRKNSITSNSALDINKTTI